MGLESLESRFLVLFVIPNSSQLHVGNILNQKTQCIAMAYFDNQHLAFTMEELAFHTINTLYVCLRPNSTWTDNKNTVEFT